MRLGGPILKDCPDPESWIAALRKAGYSAAYCPVTADAGDDVVRAYADAARKADLVIAEVGAWSNPLSPNEDERRAALEKCRTQLALADRIGAFCCVNISGSRGEQWDGHHADNLTSDTFDMIVEVVRGIVDEVKPTRTFYTLETMPWMYPDSAESYLRLIEAIGRPRFAVHFDPVNLICSPQRYYSNGELIRHFIVTLGPHIKSCHAKDVLLRPGFITHLDEVRPGLGNLDYGAFLREFDKLGSDIPVMLEHLSTEEEYGSAAEYVRSVAQKEGVTIR